MDEKNISQRILTGFTKLDYTFEIYENYPPIYNSLKDHIPKTEITFKDFDLNTCIGCEIMCAAICHSINWDFLRKRIREKTILNIDWLFPLNLMRIESTDVYELLSCYEKKDRIRAEERAELLRDIGEHLVRNQYSYIDLFFDSSSLRNYIDIKKYIKQFDAFSGDPAEKKFRLLIQCVSDYESLLNLSNYYEPTIDYHIIRMYIRRGVVKPVRKETVNYLLNDDVVRKESTIGALRTVCANSMNTISWLTQLDVKTVSRIEWWIARTICINDKPDCLLVGEDSQWVQKHYEKCPFYDICQARRQENEFLMVNEPKYGGKSF